DMALYAVRAVLPRQQYGRHPDAAARTARHRGAAPAGAVRYRSAAVAARRAVVALAQSPDLCRAVAGAPALLDRAGAGRPVRAERARPDRTKLPPLAHHRHGAGYSEHGGAIYRRRTRTALIRGVRQGRSHRARSRGTGRFRAAAACRAPDRLVDRRGILAARDVAVAPQADG